MSDRRLEGARPEWRRPLEAALRAAPDPEHASKLAGDLLAAVPDARLGEMAARPEALATVLCALCGFAPFFVPFLRRHPDWLPGLVADDLTRPCDHATLRDALDRTLASEGSEGPELALRRFKYRELARITVRDCTPALVPLERSGETLAELSALADTLLDGALAIASVRVAADRGPPQWRDTRGHTIEVGFCVLALGKLGSEELNYSSDVDLVYIHESAPDLEGDLLPGAYFTRVAHELGGLVAASSSEGFLYRIDLDLRPKGADGALVVSDTALAQYYEAWAATWEKAAFMKARPVAGDLELGWRAIRAIDPMIYQSSMDYASVRAIRSLKGRVAESRSSAAGFDVKVDPGGIRDVEFVAQALQLLHGARVPQVRDRSTQGALERLAEVGVVEQDDAAELVRDYRFLRRIEHRLQMEEEHQAHRVPKEGALLARLARAMGFLDEDGASGFERELARVRQRVEREAARLSPEGGVERIAELFARGAPKLVGFPASRAMLEELGAQFAAHIDTSPDPERALNNLDRFVHGVGARRFYYELLLDRPELVPRLAALFGASNHLSGYLASHPRLIEPVFDDPDRLLLSRAELEADLEGLLADAPPERDPAEHALDALRLFHHRQVINVGLLDIAQRVERAEVEGALTDIAEVCLAGALELAIDPHEGAAHVSPDATFLVVGMGKLASRELGYGSDLDLVFLYDVPEEAKADVGELQNRYIRRAQRLISALQTTTAEGSCYEVDARLRPSGNQGTLVTSLAGFRRHHERSAVWERQALLRARPVAGDRALGERFVAARREILRRPLPADLASEIRHIRRRMETELARETQSRRDFKTGRGGVLDVEAVVQYLQLVHGSGHPELLEVTRLEDGLARLEAEGLLSTLAARALRDGWDFLQRLGSRLRILENRSISDLDEQRGDLDGLARRMGYPETGRDAGPRRALLSDYARHTEAIRAVYLETLGEEEEE